jgi:tetratricopeptide (TPR) repeat protein
MDPRESTHRPRLRRPCWALALALLGGSGCQGDPTRGWCLEGDLGGYRLESLGPLGPPEQGCQASYRDGQGRAARARVTPFRPGRFAQEGPPIAFEKFLVFARPGAERTQVRWYTEGVIVELELDGLPAPEGPVLRAYLYQHPSAVADEVRAREHDVELLRVESRQTPKDARPHLDLARNYRKLGNTIMAAQEYHISVELAPGCFDCYLELGLLYRDLRHWDLAIRALRKASGLEPAEPRAWLALGDLSYALHNRSEAMLAYRRALGLQLEEADRGRLTERLAALEKGEFMIEVLPHAADPPPAPPDAGPGE